MSAEDKLTSIPALADDVRRWKDERARLEARLQRIVRKIEAAELLFPGIGSGQPETKISGRRVTRRSGNSMGDGVKAAIIEAGSSLGPSEIRERVERLGFAEQLSKNPNYLYTVIFRLTNRGELVRDGDRYGLPTGDNSPEEEPGKIIFPGS